MITLKDDYIEKCRGNVATMLDFYHKNGMIVPDELIKKINFAEEIEKVFYYTFSRYEERVDIRETTAVNCIKNLNFKAIEPYFNYSWIVEDGIKYDNSLIRTALYYEKKEVLEKSLEIVKKEIEGNKKNLISSNELENKFFKEVLDLGSLLRVAKEIKSKKEHVDFLYDYFKKSVVVFEDFYNSKRGQFGLYSKDDRISFEDWHKQQSKFKAFFSHFSREDSLNELLVSEKKYLSILKDVLSQYKGEKNPFADKDLVEMGLENLNFQYIDWLYKNKQVTDKDLSDCYNSFLNNQFKEFEGSFSFQYNDSLKHISFKRIAEIEKFFEKNNIKYEYEPLSIAAILSIDNKDAKKLLDKVENLDKIKIINDLTINQLAYLNEKVESIPEKNQKMDVPYESEKDFISANYPSAQSYLMLSSRQVLNNVDLSEEDRLKAQKVLIESRYKFIPEVNLSNEELKIFLQKEHLNDTLKNNEEKNNKKLKI